MNYKTSFNFRNLDLQCFFLLNFKMTSWEKIMWGRNVLKNHCFF